MAEKKTEKNTEQTVDLAAVKAEIANMLADARAEAGRIVDEARKSVGVNTKERAAAIAADKERGEELVEIRLVKDSHKYKDNVFVGCNGENVVIQRGKRVKIKRKFAEILDHSQLQDAETSDLIDRMSGEAEKMDKM